jgi:hypothetical protein
MKKLFIKSWPYLTSLIAGLSIFLIGIKLHEDYKNLVINIAATLLAIPILFLIYELAKRFSSKRLNKELFDYAKMQTDREVLSIVNQLMKLVYSYQKQDKSHRGLQKLLNNTQYSLQDIFHKETYFGFQIFKSWTVTEDKLTRILENPFIVQRLEDEHTISIIKILKNINWLQDLHRNVDDLYEVIGSVKGEYIIKSGSQISEYNTSYPDRKLLLRNLGKDKFQVVDFGDFAPNELPKLLTLCKVNSTYVDTLALAVFGVIEAINSWVRATGNEFIVDTRIFRPKVPA